MDKIDEIFGVMIGPDGKPRPVPPEIQALLPHILEQVVKDESRIELIKTAHDFWTFIDIIPDAEEFLRDMVRRVEDKGSKPKYKEHRAQIEFFIRLFEFLAREAEKVG